MSLKLDYSQMGPLELYRHERDRRYPKLMAEAIEEFLAWDTSKAGKKERRKQYASFKLNKKAVTE